MDSGETRSMLQLRSLAKENGELELSLARIAVPVPDVDEVVVRIDAAPINPSDIGLLFGAADLNTARQSGTAQNPVIIATIPESRRGSMAGRLNRSLPVGNEGAGVVVGAGSSADAQALLGKTVAVFGGAMYSQYRCIENGQCLILPDGTTAKEGASCFINPLTSLGMVETMRQEGHKALVHTAAASNLGQMLNRICIADGVGLVNIVRTVEQEDLLRTQGARHVCNSSKSSFLAELAEAVDATGATIAFDAIGGGDLVGQILAAMEAALSRGATEYSRYGSSTLKQVYIYGGLDAGPTVLNRNFGFAWSVGGWLLWPFLQRIGPVAQRKLSERVVAELTTTFASHYLKEISLGQALHLSEIAAYGRRTTGAKYLINPNKGVAA
jgi:NADPH2:quinone reductase